MADTIEINGKTYTVPEEQDLTLGDMEIIQESFGGSPPEEVDMRDVRMLKAIIRITLEHAGESITDDEIRKLPMTVLKQDPAVTEADAVPPLAPAAASQLPDTDDNSETLHGLATLRTASGAQS